MRVAIVVAGSFRRYFLESSANKLVRPLVEQGYDVDYFLSLTTEEAKAYRADDEYMSKITWDPVFGPEIDWLGRKLPIPTAEHIKSVIRAKIEGQCGTVRHVAIRDQVDIDSNPQLKWRRKKARSLRKHEDPDTRFPLLDLRNPKVIERTATANRNFLRLHLAVQGLWDRLLEAEEEDGAKYGHVFFLRDDAWWIEDFDFRGLISKYADLDSAVYLPACDARDPPLVMNEVCDHGLIAERSVAELFGRYFDNLFVADLEACTKRMPEDVRRNGVRGCNSEMILKHMLDTAPLNIRFVGQGSLPFERSAHVRLGESDTRETTCFHKFCQSKKDRLNVEGIKKCKDLEFK
jgi:hypothetical protein